MPLREARSVCFFGDSQLGCVKQAFEQGLVAPPDGAHYEFWGAPGPGFRKLIRKNGRIVAPGEALDMVRQVNGQGRETLAPDDFDGFIFFGARLRVVEFFAPFLHRMRSPGSGQSQAVLEAAAEGWLLTNKAFYLARDFANRGARVLIMPSPFPTDGIGEPLSGNGPFAAYPRALEADNADRDVVWAALKSASQRHGPILIGQAEDTVCRGSMTQSRYARAGAREMNDVGHKNASYAARALRDVLTNWCTSDQDMRQTG